MPNRKKVFDLPLNVSGSNLDVPTLIGGMQIPFAMGECTGSSLATDATGAPLNVKLSAFGYQNTVGTIALTGAQPYPDLFSNPTTFTQGYNNNIFFTMPYDVTVGGIKFSVTSDGNTTNLNGTTYAFVALATSDNSTMPLQFTILNETLTISSFPFVKSGNEGCSNSLEGEKIQLMTNISAGTLVSIVCGVFTTDGTRNVAPAYLTYGGSILFTPKALPN